MCFGQEAPPYAAWARTFGVEQNSQALEIVGTPDGGYAYIGVAFFEDSARAEFRKLSVMGNSEWVKYFGETELCIGQSLGTTSDGGYIIGAQSITNPATGMGDINLIKTDGGGQEEWSRMYDFGQDEFPFNIKQTDDGGYIIAGTTMSMGMGGYDMLIMKADVFGDSVWAETFGGIEDDYAFSVIETADGGFVAGGFMGFYAVPEYYLDAHAVKLDADGNLVWIKIYSLNDLDAIVDLKETADGDIIFTGVTGGLEENEFDGLLIKTDADGDTIWTEIFGGSEYELINRMVIGEAGDIVIAGTSESYSVGMQDLCVWKYSSDGDSIWMVGEGDAYDDAGNGIVLSPDGGFVVCGSYNSSLSTNTEAWVVKWTPDGVRVSEYNARIPEDAGWLEVFPNPFNQQAAISFKLQAAGRVELKVFDLTGREVGSLVNGYLSSGEHEVIWNAEGMTSGVYFVKLTGSGIPEPAVSKVVLVK